MEHLLGRGAVVIVAAGVTMVGGYLGLVTGAVPVDLGVGRRTRPLGPLSVDIAAPREVIFDVLSEPYLGRQSRAMAEKIEILDRGSDMVLAAHRTPIPGRLSGRLVATTVDGPLQPSRSRRLPAHPRTGSPRRGTVPAHR